MDLTIGCSISSSSITSPVTCTSSGTVALHYHCSLILNVVISTCLSPTSPSSITNSVIIVLTDIINSSSITSLVTSTSSITVALY